jgi:hypothetical protein
MEKVCQHVQHKIINHTGMTGKKNGLDLPSCLNYFKNVVATK